MDLSNIFQFCPRCGTESPETGVIPFRCQQCEFCFFFNPVSAVAGIVSDNEGQVLMLRRARDPGKGKLGLPGGFIDIGESAEEALIRESHEEVKLPLSDVTYLCSGPNTYTYRGVTVSVLDIFYAANVASFENLAAEESEVEGIHICHPGEEELSQMAFESNRKALELWLSRA